jgi:cobalt/nickel transport system permease protein
MNNIGNSLFDIGHMDALAAGDSPVHRLDPRVKLITTLAFIVAVVSFGRYTVWALLPFFVYPVALISAGGLSAGDLFKRALIISPLAIALGIFNPLIDRQVIFHIGPLGISGGWASLISIFLRFTLTAMATLALIASTGFNAVCDSLLRFGAPKPFVVQLLFFYRYIFVLTDEADRMDRARSLRSFGSRGMGFRAFVSLVGHLLLRTLDRAERVYRAMCCRGFDGHIPMMRSMRLSVKDVGFLIGWVSVFILFRYCDISTKLGTIVTRLFS